MWSGSHRICFRNHFRATRVVILATVLLHCLPQLHKTIRVLLLGLQNQMCKGDTTTAAKQDGHLTPTSIAWWKLFHSARAVERRPHILVGLRQVSLGPSSQDRGHSPQPAGKLGSQTKTWQRSLTPPESSKDSQHSFARHGVEVQQLSRGPRKGVRRRWTGKMGCKRTAGASTTEHDEEADCPAPCPASWATVCHMLLSIMAASKAVA